MSILKHWDDIHIWPDIQWYNLLSYDLYRSDIDEWDDYELNNHQLSYAERTHNEMRNVFSFETRETDALADS